MARDPLVKPELHQPILDTIARIQAAHQAGGGGFPLTDLVRLFAPSMNAEDTALVARRGDLVLTPGSGGQGSFTNTGEPVQTNRSGVTVTIPATVRGTYESTADTFRLAFDRDQTLSGRVLLFTVRLEQIRADQRVVDVILSNDTFNQTIIHGSAV